MGKIRALQVKKERQATGLTLLEGERFIEEVLRGGVHIETVVGSGAFWARRTDLVRALAAAGIATSLASPKQMSILTATEQSAGVLAVVKWPRWTEAQLWERVERAEFLGLLLVGLQDPGNTGALIRSLAGAGASGLWLSQGSPELGSPKVLRASAGAVFRIPVLEGAAPPVLIRKCRERGIQTLAASPKGGRPHTLFDLTRPTLLVLGEEGGGLENEILQTCDHGINISMPGGTESLNVAAAGAILAFEAVRQRRLTQAASRRSSS